MLTIPTIIVASEGTLHTSLSDCDQISPIAVAETPPASPRRPSYVSTLDTPDLDSSITPESRVGDYFAPPTPNGDGDLDDSIHLLDTPTGALHKSRCTNQEPRPALCVVDSDEDVAAILGGSESNTTPGWLFGNLGNKNTKEPMWDHDSRPSKGIKTSDITKYDRNFKNFDFGALSRAIKEVDSGSTQTEDLNNESTSAPQARSSTMGTTAMTELIPASTGVPNFLVVAEKASIKALDIATEATKSLKFLKALLLHASERLNEDPARCIASIGSLLIHRCSSKINLSPGVTQRLVDSMHVLKGSSEFNAVKGVIEELVDNATCRHTHRPKARKAVELLWDHLSLQMKPSLVPVATSKEILAMATEEHREQTLPKSPIAFAKNPTTIENYQSDEPLEPPGEAISSRSLSLPSSQTRIRHRSFHSVRPQGLLDLWLRAQPLGSTAVSSTVEKHIETGTGSREKDTSLPTNLRKHPLKNLYNMDPYAPQKNQGRKTQDLIREEMEKAILKGDTERCGYIYVFWAGVFGYLKIGRAENVENRLAEWRAQCGHEALEHRDREVHVPVKVKHIHRLESLIHAELGPYRRVESNCKCGKKHKEWFEVSDGLAFQVIRKWTNWMQTTPYVDGVLRSTITTEEKNKLCELTEATKLAPPLPRHARRHSSPALSARPAVAWSVLSAYGLQA